MDYGIDEFRQDYHCQCITRIIGRQNIPHQLVDGDVLRTANNNTKYDRQGRHLNVLRASSMAYDIVETGQLAICALISPDKMDRDATRNIFGKKFVEVFVNTPLSVCMDRDVKGLYNRYRHGRAVHIAGLDVTYEQPDRPEISIDAVTVSAEDNAAIIYDYLVNYHHVTSHNADVFSKEVSR